MNYSKTKSEVFFETKEKSWEDTAPGIKKRMIGYDINIVSEKESFGYFYNHFHSQTAKVESKSFEAIVGNQKKNLNGGDDFFTPLNVSNKAVCLESGVLIDVFSPIGKDFLDISHTKN
ncbi:cupin domain-containing protein [Aquimarina addita]|uniref:Cupin domain-containing protein n=1 Tax=Aquimarina addita TaxID=870485 RepID=A0ABP6UM67_9FLAO